MRAKHLVIKMVALLEVVKTVAYNPEERFVLRHGLKMAGHCTTEMAVRWSGWSYVAALSWFPHRASSACASRRVRSTAPDES